MYRRTRDHGFGAEVKRRILLGTFVLSSGYSLEVPDENSRSAAGFSFLQKPYQSSALMRTVRTSLETDGLRSGGVATSCALAQPPKA